MKPLLIGGGVLVAAILAWLFWPGRSDAPAQSETPSRGSQATSNPDTAVVPPPVAAPPAAPEPAPVVMDAEPAAAEVMSAPDSASAAAPAPAATAPPPAPKPPEGPRDPVLVLEPLPPTPGVPDEQAAAWAQLVHAYFIEGPPPREARALKEQLDAIDIIDITPAFINALDGLDMSDAIDIRNAGNLIDYWHQREGEKLHFFFELDAGNVEQTDIDKRVTAVEGWRNEWKKKLDDPARLADFRLAVQERLLERRSKAGG